jgi:hypothetical protein
MTPPCHSLEKRNLTVIQLDPRVREDDRRGIEKDDWGCEDNVEAV